MPLSGGLGRGRKAVTPRRSLPQAFVPPSHGLAVASTIATAGPRSSLSPDHGFGPIVARLAV